MHWTGRVSCAGLALYEFSLGSSLYAVQSADRASQGGSNHSGPAWLAFSATERFMKSTQNATAKVNTAIIQKVSK